MLKKPYLIFLGDAPDQLAAKVATGIKQWRPQDCLGQYCLPNCQADCQLPEMDISTAKEAGAQTLVIGVANRGGIIPDSWLPSLKQALLCGMDIAAGLHQRLIDVPQLRTLAAQCGQQLIDVRCPSQTFPVATGKKRTGKRLLPVGTDCSCGKMYTALAIERALLARGSKATFRATGQTGSLISGTGISIDAVVADFIAGAVELLSPDNDAEHWDVIEGQGSLFHPSFAGVTTGIIHGAQPDALVLCHEPTRKTMRGIDYPLPDLKTCMELNLTMARLTNSSVRFVGISINTAALTPTQAEEVLNQVEDQFGIPVVDPVRHGVDRIIDQLTT